MKTPRAILVSRLRFLGDIVLSTPLLETLHEHFPGAAIDYLGCPPHVDVLEGHPAVDSIHRLPAAARAADMLAMARRLRARRYDVAIDLFGNPRSALLVAATGARVRIGPRRGLRSRLYTHRRGRPEGSRSAVRHHLDKAVPLLGHEAPERRPVLYVGDDERERAVRELGLDVSRGVVLVHPGSTWPDKAWPEERWTELLRWLQDRVDADVRVVSPPSQPGLADRVAASTRARALPPSSVREILGVLAHTGLYVGNDGGILHAAVALDVPSLGLFGPTEPDIWFPYEAYGPYRVLHRCDPASVGPDGVARSRLLSLDVETVIEALDEVLALAKEREGARTR